MTETLEQKAEAMYRAKHTAAAFDEVERAHREATNG